MTMRRTRGIGIVLALFSVVSMPLLSYLATPLVRSDGHHGWTLLCTLKGVRAVYVAELADPTHNGDGAGDDGGCPALQLLQLAAMALPGLGASAPAAVRRRIDDMPTAGRAFAVESRPRSHQARAPPMV